MNLCQGSGQRGFFGIWTLFADDKKLFQHYLGNRPAHIISDLLNAGRQKPHGTSVVHLSGRDHDKQRHNLIALKQIAWVERFVWVPPHAIQRRLIDSAQDHWNIGTSFTKSPQKLEKRRSFLFLWKLLDRYVRLLVPSRNLHFAWETGRWSQLCSISSAILAMCSF